MSLPHRLSRWLRWRWFLAPVLAAIVASWLLRPSHRPLPSTSGPLPQQAYVWQRAWTDATCEAVSSCGRAFDRLIVLKTEVTWHNGQPRVTQIALNAPALQAARASIGLALRIGAPNGRVLDHTAQDAFLAELAYNAVCEARRAGLTPVELQVDFDCPESQLADYAGWMMRVRQRLAPLPVTITALPCWLDRPAFQDLAHAAPDYILQVHSLKRPERVKDMKPLCDPGQTRAWIEKAARLGVPFRVALPTCGYRLAFDRTLGRFAGLISEGPARSWPASVETRALTAQPDAMAGLVGEWMAARPRALRGVIWFRLPVAGDTLNWSWPTLSTVMQGRVPRPQIEAEVTRSGTDLVEVRIVNQGEAEPEDPVRVKVAWRERVSQDKADSPGTANSGPPASEALGTFETLTEGAHELVWQGSCRLQPGEHRTVGWIRLAGEWEVRAHVDLESQ